MKCTVAVLVALFALLATSVRSAPQRGIDFLPGDEEVQAVVKPIAGDSDVPDQQRQQAPDINEEANEQKGQYILEPSFEVPATVDPVENELQTEEPEEDVTEVDDNDFSIDDQYTVDPLKESEADPVTKQPEEDVAQEPVPDKNDAPSAKVDDTPTPGQNDTTLRSGDQSQSSDPVANFPSEEGLTTDPIVVAEQSSTESSDDSNQFAEDVNSLADNSSNRVRFGLEDSQDGSETAVAQATPTPKPKALANEEPHHSTELPSVATVSSSDEYDDSKSLESHEDDGQVQLKDGPNDVQSTGEDQFRTLPPWFGPTTRLAGYDHWQQQGGFQQRSTWQPRPTGYPSGGFDGFHGHGFHRSSWH